MDREVCQVASSSTRASWNSYTMYHHHEQHQLYQPCCSYLGFRLNEFQEEGPHVYDPVETGERYHVVDT